MSAARAGLAFARSSRCWPPRYCSGIRTIFRRDLARPSSPLLPSGRAIASSAAFRVGESGIAASSATASAPRRRVTASAGSIPIARKHSRMSSCNSMQVRSDRRVAPLANRLKISRPLRSLLGQGGVQDLSTSNAFGAWADGDQARANSVLRLQRLYVGLDQPRQLGRFARRQVASGNPSGERCHCAGCISSGSKCR